MPARIVLLLDERKKLERELTDARKKLAMGGGEGTLEGASGIGQVGDIKFMSRSVSGIELKDLRSPAAPTVPRPRRRSRRSRRRFPGFDRAQSRQSNDIVPLALVEP